MHRVLNLGMTHGCEPFIKFLAAMQGRSFLKIQATGKRQKDLEKKLMEETLSAYVFFCVFWWIAVFKIWNHRSKRLASSP